MILKELNQLLEAREITGKLTHGYGILCFESDRVSASEFDEDVEVYLDEAKFCKRIGMKMEEAFGHPGMNIPALHADPEIQAQLQARTGIKLYRNMSWDELTNVENWSDFSESIVILHKF